MTQLDPKALNIKEAIRNLEYLVEVAENPQERAKFQNLLEHQKRQLRQLTAAAAGASGS